MRKTSEDYLFNFQKHFFEIMKVNTHIAVRCTYADTVNIYTRF